MNNDEFIKLVTDTVENQDVADQFTGLLLGGSSEEATEYLRGYVLQAIPCGTISTANAAKLCPVLGITLSDVTTRMQSQKPTKNQAAA